MKTDSEAVKKAGHPAPQQVDRDADGGDIHVLEGLVMLAVVDHRPRDAVHHREDIGVKGVPQVDVREKRVGEIALGDDAVHHHQDGGAGDRPDDGIDREQERVGPVGCDLPAQPGGDLERSPGFGTGGFGRRIAATLIGGLRHPPFTDGEFLRVIQQQFRPNQEAHAQHSQDDNLQPRSKEIRIGTRTGRPVGAWRPCPGSAG